VIALKTAPKKPMMNRIGAPVVPTIGSLYAAAAFGSKGLGDKSP